jgi:hypothetical protein
MSDRKQPDPVRDSSTNYPAYLIEKYDRTIADSIRAPSLDEAKQIIQQAMNDVIEEMQGKIACTEDKRMKDTLMTQYSNMADRIGGLSETLGYEFSYAAKTSQVKNNIKLRGWLDSDLKILDNIEDMMKVDPGSKHCYDGVLITVINDIRRDVREGRIEKATEESVYASFDCLEERLEQCREDEGAGINEFVEEIKAILEYGSSKKNQKIIGRATEILEKAGSYLEIIQNQEFADPHFSERGQEAGVGSSPAAQAASGEAPSQPPQRKVYWRGHHDIQQDMDSVQEDIKTQGISQPVLANLRKLYNEIKKIPEDIDIYDGVRKQIESMYWRAGLANETNKKIKDRKNHKPDVPEIPVDIVYQFIVKQGNYKSSDSCKEFGKKYLNNEKNLDRLIEEICAFGNIPYKPAAVGAGPSAKQQAAASQPQGLGPVSDDEDAAIQTAYARCKTNIEDLTKKIQICADPSQLPAYDSELGRQNKNVGSETFSQSQKYDLEKLLFDATLSLAVKEREYRVNAESRANTLDSQMQGLQGLLQTAEQTLQKVQADLKASQGHAQNLQNSLANSQGEAADQKQRKEGYQSLIDYLNQARNYAADPSLDDVQFIGYINGLKAQISTLKNSPASAEPNFNSNVDNVLQLVESLKNEHHNRKLTADNKKYKRRSRIGAVSALAASLLVLYLGVARPKPKEIYVPDPDSKSRIAKLETELNKSKEDYKNAEAARKTAEQNASQLEKSVKTEIEQKQAFHAQLEEAQKKLQEGVGAVDAEAVKKYEQEIQKRDQRIAALEQEISKEKESLAERFAQLEYDIKVEAEQRKNAEAQLDEANRKLQESAGAADAEAVKKLREQMSQKEIEIKRMNAELRIVSEELEKLIRGSAQRRAHLQSHITDPDIYELLKGK